MGSSSPTTTTQVNKSEPDALTQKWRQSLYNDASQLYKMGVPDYYSGQTVAPFSQQTQQGLGMLEQQAQAGAPNLQAANQASSRALSGYNPAMAGAGQIAGGSLQNPWGARIAQAGQQQTTAGVGALQGFTSAQNPYLDSLYSQGAERVANDVNANFARGGRYGANAAHTGALTEGLGNLYSSIYAPAYENQQNRSLSAAGQLADIQQADRAATMQGYGQAGAFSDADMNRRLAGTELQGGLWSQGNTDAMRAAGMLPSIYNYGSSPGQQMVNIGSAYEGLTQEQIAADMAKWNYNANAPWDYLNNYASVVSGTPSGQTSTATGQQPGRNRSMGALGGAASGAGLASGLMSAGALNSWNPWGWALMAGGALAGAYM